MAAASTNTGVSTPGSVLSQLIADLGVRVDATEDVTFEGADPVFPVPFLVGTVGAAAIAATGIAAAELWRLRTGRSQRIAVNVRAAAAAMRSARYLRIQPHADSVPIDLEQEGSQARGFHRTRDGRWIYLHTGFPHHVQRILSVLGARTACQASCNQQKPDGGGGTMVRQG